MKKVLFTVTALALALVCAGCSIETSAPDAPKKTSSDEGMSCMDKYKKCSREQLDGVGGRVCWAQLNACRG